MITLGTGLPGNGKTLFMLSYIRDKGDKENRPVFYHGIDIIGVPSVIPWTQFKAEEWFDLPEGSIIVIDESQFVFPRKPNGSQLPPHYENLAVHRHKGFDIYLITQHPTLIDNFVRKLVGQHFHSVRKFGFDRATIYEWSRANPAPEQAAQQKSAIPMKWAFKKEVYEWYKSAEVHTVKKRFPWQIAAVAFLGVLVFGALYMYISRFGQPPAPAAVSTEISSAAPASVASSPSGSDKVFDPVADARQYLAMNTPRVSGLPQTAPKYDALTVPVRVPVPAACIQVGQVSRGKVSCKCFSQQGTPMDVEFNMCIEFARNGYFQDFDADKDRQQDQRAARGVAALSDRPEQPIRQDRSDSPVIAFADIPDAPRLGGARPAPDLNDGPPAVRASRTAVSE